MEEPSDSTQPSETTEPATDSDAARPPAAAGEAQKKRLPGATLAIGGAIVLFTALLYWDAKKNPGQPAPQQQQQQQQDPQQPQQPQRPQQPGYPTRTPDPAPGGNPGQTVQQWARILPGNWRADLPEGVQQYRFDPNGTFVTQLHAHDGRQINGSGRWGIQGNVLTVVFERCDVQELVGRPDTIELVSWNNGRLQVRSGGRTADWIRMQ